ncbi:Sin3 associated polypeptide p18-domain-containing protein [Hypoxylon trugodes]|uniref:Sin3 associated polypeptide p18-domain-containing protein n=1 Tax=Hypoxylon trugodes TaxID=326681 RepID=UPI002195B4D9|nr:Sin3 associated polypeptide p18-domain-containing protein [Hypoxylon trugodes]KAI1384693.1 Sin3 associated polypeptide p18-domain-containing protein [Hypoxylon trugodes]
MDRHTTPPFMLRLFYRTGAFHRPDEFTTSPLPPHITIHTWPDCTLTELTYIIAAARPGLLPDPAIGTRLVFRLIFPDTRGSNAVAAGHHSASAKYTVKDLGSVVIGGGSGGNGNRGRGLDPEDPEAEGGEDPDAAGVDNDGDKTLGESRFVVGDYISCAVLHPLPDGSVAPASSARTGPSTNPREPRYSAGRPPSGSFGSREHENGHVRPGRSRNSGRGFDGFGNIPMGEWRRGERLPDPPAMGRGRGGRQRF